MVACCQGLGAEDRTAPNTPRDLRKLAIQSLESGDTKAATKYAAEWMTKNTNAQAYYYGDWLHDGTQIMGLAALKEGRLDEAKNYLLKAGATPGSPRLNSSGPSMVLAQQLLEKDEKEVVIQYLDLVAKFWAHASEGYLRKAEEKTPGAAAFLVQLHKDHQKQIDLWKVQIRDGKKPKLNASGSLR